MFEMSQFSPSSNTDFRPFRRCIVVIWWSLEIELQYVILKGTPILNLLPPMTVIHQLILQVCQETDSLYCWLTKLYLSFSHTIILSNDHDVDRMLNHNLPFTFFHSTNAFLIFNQLLKCGYNFLATFVFSDCENNNTVFNDSTHVSAILYHKRDCGKNE